MKTLLSLLSIFVFYGAYSQCNVTITPSSTTVPCGGGLITLTANGSGNTTAVLDNDFDGGNAGAGWNVSPAGQFNNPCDPSIDGGTYMWMGNTTAAPRTLETAPLDVSCGGDVCFYLDMATQGGTGSCEGPDLTNEGVYFEYSIDGGTTWTTIQYFQPNAGGTTGPYLAWAQYCFTIPPAAVTANTIFHWFQSGSSGNCCDHWGIDNVTITAQNCNDVWYDWDNIPGTTGPTGDPQSQQVNVTSDTTFTVCYTDGAGFNCCETITITVNGMGAPTSTPVDETCLGNNDGSVTIVEGAGGVGPYTYTITGGPTIPAPNNTGNFTGLAPGTYNYTVDDNGSGCSVTGTFIINPGISCCPSPINVVLNGTDLLCNGDNSGQIDVTATMGDGGPYNYSIDGGNTFQLGTNFSGLAAGTYTIDVTDNTGCIGSATVTINEPAALTITEAQTDMSCFGVCNGTAGVTVGGGTGPYNYNWTPAGVTGQGTANISNLCAGTYSCVVTDNNGCTITSANIVINEPTQIQATTGETPASCGQADGTLLITNIVGGTGNYPSQIWYDANNVQVPNPGAVVTGTYTLVVIDSDGCQNSFTQNVSAQMGPSANVTAFTDVTCNAACDGTIDIAINGGTLPYNIVWNPAPGVGQGTTSISGLCAGTYTATITDDNGCQITVTQQISEPAALAFSSTSVDLDCFQQCIGEIHFTNETGGTQPHQYSIDNGMTFQASPDFTGLCSGTYDLVLQDANLCQATAQVIITEPTQLTNVITTIDALCNGYCDGEISVTAAGGTAPYTYNWANAIAPNNSQTATALCAGSYDVTLEDANGCQVVNNGIVINEPPAMTIQNITSTDALCSNTCDGTITVTEPTAVAFKISGLNTGTIINQANGNFINLCPDTYDIEVANIDGCIATGQIVVGVPNPVSLVVSPDVTICQNDNTTMTATASGGDGNFTYTWDNVPGTNTSNVNPMTTTTYSVYATDGNGCQTNTMVITVNVLQPLQVTALTSQDICPGQVANISALGQGGDGNYTYSWDDGTTTLIGQFQSVSPTVTTTYSVTLSDGCTSTPVTDQITITVNPVPQVAFSGVNLDGCTPVMPTFTNNTDPTLSAQCLWDFGDGNFSNDCNPSHLYEDPGCYDVTLTVTSVDGCVGTASQAQMVCVYDIPVANFEFGPQPTTILEPQITFNNFSSGGDYHLWTFGDGDSSNLVNPVHDYTWVEPNSYDVMLVESNVHGCADTAYATVVIDDIFLIYVPNAFTPNNDGNNDVFLPVLSGTSTENYSLYIYDRWGQIIFESNAPGEGWTGTVNGQTPVKTDVYTWKIVLRTFENQKKEFVGHVTLLK